MKRLVKLLTALLLAAVIISTTSCKKNTDNNSNNGGGTPTPAEVDYFIDVDFLPETETNGEVAPRFMANINDELVMIELRPTADSLVETVLLLGPDNYAMMLCGNDHLMICAEYDMETNMPANDVLLVTSMADTALLLTKCVMDWNTNDFTTGDMMVLPIDNIDRNQRSTNDIDADMRRYFFYKFVKPLAASFEKAEHYCGMLGIPAAGMFASIRMIVTTELTEILFSDDPENLIDNTTQQLTSSFAGLVKSYILNLFPEDDRTILSRILAAYAWYKDGGHGEVNNYQEDNSGTDDLHFGYMYSHAFNVTEVSSSYIPSPIYIVGINVSNVTESSAFLKGSFRFGSSSITPVEMGYIYSVNGGTEYAEEDMDFNGLTITGLQKATKYVAQAYVATPMGDVVFSPAVTFCTLGFEAFPNSLSFPAEGDTKYVSLLYSQSDITDIEITSCPSWCSVTQDELGLLAVTVGETTETRSGTITITGHSIALGSMTQDIAVIQNGANQSGFFAGTPFYNYGDFSTYGTYDYTYTYITRREDIVTHTYYNETYTLTEHEDNKLGCGYFKNDTVIAIPYLITWFNRFVFKDNSIDILYGSETIIHCFNGVAFDINSCNIPPYSYYVNKEGEITVSGYFINNNTFCLKIQANYTHHTTGYSHGWINERHTDEEVHVFTIDPNTNSLSYDWDYSSNMNAIDFSNNFEGIIKKEMVQEFHGTGGHDASYGKNDIVNQINDSKKFKRVPTYPKEMQE